MSAASVSTLAIEDTLTDWIRDLEASDLPATVRDRVEDLLLDALASAFAGRTQTLLERIDPVARLFAGDGSSTVIGDRPAAPAAAAYLNAYAITSATLCDVYRPGLCHVTPVTVPPLLALAELAGVTWECLLVAAAVGFEVTVRLASGLDYPAMRARGWHTPGVVGQVGAAAGGARLLGLAHEETSSALAHAALQAGGTFAALGTEAVKFNQARGAVSGLLAVLMGRSGASAPTAWLTGADGGLVASHSPDADAARVVEGLGDHWEMEQISMRRWPAASSVQALIELGIELSTEHDLGLEEIEAIDLRLPPRAFEVSGRAEWGDPLSAQQSAHWILAATIADGDWWLGSNSAERVADERLVSFARNRVHVAPDPALSGAAVRISVDCGSASPIVLARDDAPGDPGRPLQRAEILAKLRRCALAHGSVAAGEAIADFVAQARLESRASTLVAAAGAS